MKTLASISTTAAVTLLIGTFAFVVAAFTAEYYIESISQDWTLMPFGVLFTMLPCIVCVFPLQSLGFWAEERM